MNIGDIGINPSDDVPVQHVQALPQRLTLTDEAAGFRQDFRVAVDRYAVHLGNLRCLIRRVAVDQHDFVEQRQRIHQRALDRADHIADGLLFIERRQAQADGHTLPLLERQQRAQVLKFAAVEGILGKPAVDAG